jgi:hypothetical protein
VNLIWYIECENEKKQSISFPEKHKIKKVAAKTVKAVKDAKPAKKEDKPEQKHEDEG